MNTAPSSAYKIWIRLNPAFTQSTDYQNQGGFLMETVEDQADQHTRQILALKDMIRRAPYVGVQAGTAFDGEIAGDLTVGYIPTINSAGTGWEFVANNGASTTVTATGGDTLTLAAWFKGMARGTDIPTDGYFYFTDRSTNGDTADPLRMRHRLLIGDAADDDGATVASGHNVSWLSSTQDHYLMRSAQFASISPMGGTGGVFATRRSDAYDGETVWATGQTVAIGDKRGYINSNGAQTIYTATTAGTTGATPPTHTSGTASDGTVTWQFTQLQFRTAIGATMFAVNDAADNGPAWGAYIEVVRSSSSAGDTIGIELACKNKGDDKTIGSHTWTADGVFGIWLAGGGPSSTGGAPTAPSTAAIAIWDNATTWNVGIAFRSSAMTVDGNGLQTAINLGQNQMLRWDRSSATGVARLYSSLSSAGLTERLEFSDSGILAERSDSSTNTAPDVLMLRRVSTGTPANDIGAALAFEVETSASNNEIGARISAVATDVTSTSEDFELRFALMEAGAAAADVLALSPTALLPSTSDAVALGSASKMFSDAFFASGAVINFDNGDVTITHAANALTISGASNGVTFVNPVRGGAQLSCGNTTAIPAGGSTTVGLTGTSTANFGVFFGSGAPSLSAAKGSLYLRSDGSTTNDRAYIATDSAGTWTALTTAA